MSAHRLQLIRHAEKPDARAGGQGVDEHGAPDPASLSVRGWQRAGALVNFFAPLGTYPRDPRIHRPTSLWAAASSERSRRPVSTLLALAQALGIAVREDIASEDVDRFVDALDRCDGTVLASWRHEHMRAIARALVGPDAPVGDWPDDRFDMVWVFTRRDERWRVEQVEQMLLAGDREDPIG